MYVCIYIYREREREREFELERKCGMETERSKNGALPECKIESNTKNGTK